MQRKTSRVKQNNMNYKNTKPKASSGRLPYIFRAPSEVAL
jgi:hypothetical protein